MSYQLIQWLIRVAKEDSSFVYFTLEANEGIAFYSTTENSLQEQFRDILIHTTPEFEKDLESILDKINQLYPIEMLSKKLIEDEL